MTTRAELLQQLSDLPEIKELVLDKITQVINLTDKIVEQPDGEGNYTLDPATKRYLFKYTQSMFETNDNTDSAWIKNQNYYHILGPTDDLAWYMQGGGSNKPKVTIPDEGDSILDEVHTKAESLPNHKYHKVLNYDKDKGYAEVRVVAQNGGATTVKTFWVLRTAPNTFDSGEIT